MAFAPSQALVQNMSMRQEMVMTPQMIQSMEMLQLPIMELEQRISEELLENPALELEDLEVMPDEPEGDGKDDISSDADDHGDEFAGDALDTAVVAEERDREDIEYDALNDLAESSMAGLEEVDGDWSNVFDDDAAPSRSSGNGDDEDDSRLSMLVNLPSRGKTLGEHLGEQLAFRNLPEKTRILCDRIIGLLDDAGYLPADTAPSGAGASVRIDEDHLDALLPLSLRLKAEDETVSPSLSDVADALDTVQRLEPTGVGARNLTECLLIQIDAYLGAETLEYRMTEHHLDDMAANRLPLVAKSMSCTIDEVKQVLDFLRTLDPHPGYAYTRKDDRHIVPDVRIEYDSATRDFVIALNNGALPPVRVSPEYKAALAQEKRGSTEREYLRERISSAEWIIQAIEQRNRTLLAVTREIVARQRDYFLGEQEQPAPLMMQQVADAVRVIMRVRKNDAWVEEERIGVDISTVSRAVREKYAESPRGTIALRDMFTRAVGGGDERLPGSKDASNVQVMDMIKKMVEKEAPNRPLKDAQIARLLKAEGISIARRTVAKYREILGIASYSQRKQY